MMVRFASRSVPELGLYHIFSTQTSLVSPNGIHHWLLKLHAPCSGSGVSDMFGGHLGCVPAPGDIQGGWGLDHLRPCPEWLQTARRRNGHTPGLHWSLGAGNVTPNASFGCLLPGFQLPSRVSQWHKAHSALAHFWVTDIIIPAWQKWKREMWVSCFIPLPSGERQFLIPCESSHPGRNSVPENYSDSDCAAPN